MSDHIVLDAFVAVILESAAIAAVLWNIRRTRAFRDTLIRGIPVEAEVIGVHRYNRYVGVRFLTASGHAVELWRWATPKFRASISVGQHVKVRYPPLHPRRFVFTGDPGCLRVYAWNAAGFAFSGVWLLVLLVLDVLSSHG